MWFVSGVVMMYVAFPSLTDRERLAALPDINWEKVAVTPDHAMALAGATRFPRDLRLSMLNDEPVYRLVDWSGRRQAVSAVDGRAIDHASVDLALAVASRHPAAVSPELLESVDRDQWSVVARFDPLRPLYLIALGDAAGTNLYVSERTGEIVLDTNRTERVWNWFGSIPHWIYPTILRKDGALWRSVVLWISGICMVVAVTGIWIGILRMRLLRRYSSGSVSPYRGWMKWHHVTGLISGVIVLTWMFSGWLSLDPGRLFESRDAAREMMQRFAGHDAPTFAAASVKPHATAVEARFTWLGGAPVLLLIDRDGLPTPVNPATGAAMPLPENRVLDAAQNLMPKAAMTMRQSLSQYDAYWYAHHQQRVLPVLRVGFDDLQQSWFHIDPRTGVVLNRVDSSRRTYRWLFNALHSFDFPLLLMYRPAWDLVVWVLSVFGMVVSVSGVVIGWRYLKK
ncbi:PepSY domain-containing protein [soil metagenome]